MSTQNSIPIKNMPQELRRNKDILKGKLREFFISRHILNERQRRFSKQKGNIEDRTRGRNKEMVSKNTGI